MLADSIDVLLMLGHIAVIIWLVSDILLRREGTSDTRLAWITLVVLVPFIGAIVYMLFGGRWIGRKRQERHLEAHRQLTPFRHEASAVLAAIQPKVPYRFQPIFDIAGAVSDTDLLGGNAVQLLGHGDGFSNAAIADIDAATQSVHLLTYIFCLTKPAVDSQGH